MPTPTVSDGSRGPGAESLGPDATSRAIDEYLVVLDDAAFGGATRA